MKAIRVHALGSLDTLDLEEVDDPVLKTGEVRMAVKACGINFADVLMVKGQYQEKPPLPFTPGFEAVGEVVEVGEGCERLKVGDRIMGLIQNGGLAEQATLPETLAIPIPDGIDWTAAAAFPTAYGTSHAALKHRANLQPGETLVVHGAAGGVGLTAVEIGKIMGARVIATASTPEKLEVARSKGADELIDYSKEDVRQRIKDLTDGKGADVIYDPVGGKAFEASLRAINFEGRILVIGFASGDIPTIPANIVLVKNIAVIGLYWGSYSWKKPEVLMASLTELLGWLGDGKIKPHVSETHPLADASKALKALAERRSTGKVVVTMGTA